MSGSRLVRVVAESGREHAFYTQDGADHCDCGWVGADADVHFAEVAVGAVLDELSEGPLHDAMVSAAWEDFCVVDPVPVVTEAEPFTLLFWRGKVRGATDAALALARTYTEGEQ